MGISCIGSEENKVDQDEMRPPSPPKPKEFLYHDPGVKIGNGKYGPVNLIIHEKQLFALKIIPKHTIDKPKRSEHVKNEKKVLISLRKPPPTAEELFQIEQQKKQAKESDKEDQKEKKEKTTEV